MRLISVKSRVKISRALTVEVTDKYIFQETRFSQPLLRVGGKIMTSY